MRFAAVHKWISLLILIGATSLTACGPVTPAVTMPVILPSDTPTLKTELPAYVATTIEITRKGKKYSVRLGKDIGKALFHMTPDPKINMAQWYGDNLPIAGANLEWYGDFDDDNETEYLVSAYARAAIGSIAIFAIDYDTSKDEYRIFDTLYFRAACFDEFKDIDNDGSPEVLAKDEAYHIASGGGGADSVFSPIKILRYNGQKFENITEQYPNLIEKDAKHWLEAIGNNAWGQGQSDSLYMAYIADMYLLKRPDEGTKVFSKECEKYFIPYIKTQNPNSDWTCAGLLQRAKNALAKLGY